MANHKSAIKRNQQNAKRRMHNRVVKKQVKTAVRNFEAARKSGGETTDELKAAQSMLDKAAKKGAVHKRRASRKISRLARRV
ncbi:MAG: 30S ribosomal protein S20 [Thermodesulfobacteriota bacterium]